MTLWDHLWHSVHISAVFFSFVHLQEIYPVWKWDWNIVPISIACARLLSAKTGQIKLSKPHMRGSCWSQLVIPQERYDLKSPVNAVSSPSSTLSLGKRAGLPIWNDVVALFRICESEDKCRRWQNLKNDINKSDRKQTVLQETKQFMVSGHWPL